MTDASQDEFVASLEDQFGLEGYAVWFKLLEIVGRNMDKSNKCSATYPVREWKRMLRVREQKLNCYLTTIQLQRKCNLTRVGDKLTIEIPNLLKIRDNYTKNLQATCKPLATKEVEVEVEVESRTKTKPPPKPRFVKPTIDEVKTYCHEGGYRVDAEKFVDYYEANGWRAGRNPMKDWKAAVRNWHRRENQQKEKSIFE